MAFPEYKGWWIFKRPDGWEDLGWVGQQSKYINGEIIHRTDTHSYCHNIVKLGKEDGQVFKYCPVCMIKITEPNNK